MGWLHTIDRLLKIIGHAAILDTNIAELKKPHQKGDCTLQSPVVGLMDRALDLKPEVTQGCGF